MKDFESQSLPSLPASKFKHAPQKRFKFDMSFLLLLFCLIKHGTTATSENITEIQHEGLREGDSPRWFFTALKGKKWTFVFDLGKSD